LALAPHNVRHGNKEVCALLKRWLVEARKGKLMFAAVAASDGSDETGISYSGDIGVIPGILTGLDMLHKEISHVQRKRMAGDRDPLLDASFHEYNLATDAHNWDFLIWLIDAEMTRLREDAMPPLKVHFTHLEELNEPARRFFEAVYRPLLPLIGAVEDPRALGGRRSAALTPFQICLAHRRGEKVPLLQAPGSVTLGTRHRLNGRKPIVITLREAQHWDKRNSNVPAWIKFARDLQARGEDVIFVRDTFRANEPLEDFETWQMASFQVPARMALYQEAKVNLFVSNGPAGLGLFSDVPYLYFLRVFRDTEYEANNPDWWIRANGIGEGDQWPWALPHQRMIWKEDSYDNLSEAWELYGPALSANGFARPTSVMSAGVACNA
jgi:hypothetical protein